MTAGIPVMLPPRRVSGAVVTVVAMEQVLSIQNLTVS